VRELLDQDATLVNRNSDYNSYYLGLRLATEERGCQRAYIEIVRLLLERGAEIRIYPRRASRRTGTRLIRPSTTGTTRSPSSCWNAALTRALKAKARRML
jgi:hypothetical protein